MQDYGWSAVTLAAALSLAACAPDDGDRCGGDGEFRYDADTGRCVLVDTDTGSDADTSTDTPTDTDTTLDAGADTDPDTEDTDTGPTGLGEVCETSEDCAGFEADFCACDAMAPDDPCYCVISNCAREPVDTCPHELGLYCCLFKNFTEYPPLCIPQEDIDSIGSLVGCE